MKLRVRLRCPSCGEVDAKALFSARLGHGDDHSCYGSRRLGRPNPHGAIYVCPVCGWGITEPMPTGEELADRYGAMPEPGYLKDGDVRMVQFRAELKTLISLLPKKPTSLLDVGCSYGLMLKAAQELGIASLGLELAEDQVAWCHASELNVRRGGLEKLEAHEAFDIVILWDILEHLPDPSGALTRIHRHMPKGGIISLVVPDRDSFIARLLGERWWSILELHLHYPTKKGLRNVLAGAGFMPIYVGTHPKLVSLQQVARWLPGAWLRGAAVRVLPRSLRLTVDPKDQLLIRARAE